MGYVGDQGLYIADSDLKQFEDRGYNADQAVRFVQNLYRWYPAPLPSDFDWDSWFAKQPWSTVPEETETEEQSSNPDENDSDKKVGDPASDSGSKHSAPEGKTDDTKSDSSKTDESKQDLSAAKSDK